MNVGIADPALADLAWKLEAILKGYRAVACDVTGAWLPLILMLQS